MRASQWVRLRLRAIFSRGAVERELEEELRQHVEREEEERVRRGDDPARARREAALAFGGMERWKEECRDARGLRMFEDLRQDLRYGARTLGRHLGYTVVVVVILGLGIGSTASRLRRKAGSRGVARSSAASARHVAEIGRLTKVASSPCERISALRKLFSSMGPSTKARTSGAGS